MKQMVLTGLGQETDFEKNGEIQNFLVFNKGELRVPVSEDVAQIIVAAILGPNSENEAGSFDEEEEPEESEERMLDEDGVSQV